MKFKELQTTRRRPQNGYKSPHVKKSNTVLDSRFQVLGYSLCQWNFTLSEIRNPRAVFWILRAKIFPDFGFHLRSWRDSCARAAKQSERRSREEFSRALTSRGKLQIYLHNHPFSRLRRQINTALLRLSRQLRRLKISVIPFSLTSGDTKTVFHNLVPRVLSYPSLREPGNEVACFIFIGITFSTDKNWSSII